MKYVLVGYGRMGRAIDEVAATRGHERVSVVDPHADGPSVLRRLDPAAVSGADVAFEFTVPSQAAQNVVTLAEAGLAVVCGTTGWDPSGTRVQGAIAASTAGVVLAPNFSVGMNLFYAVVREAARRLGPTGLYDGWVFEAHHRAKVDAPSGTARRLASLLTEAAGGWDGVQLAHPVAGAVPAGVIHVADIRAGHEPGRHVVGFDSEHDAIELHHRARGRGGFALGAVLAAEWVRGRRGLHGFDEVLRDLFGNATKGGGS